MDMCILWKKIVNCLALYLLCANGEAPLFQFEGRGPSHGNLTKGVDLFWDIDHLTRINLFMLNIYSK